MKTPRLLLPFLVLLLRAAVFAQGVFPPPSAPTVPLMKSLDQIEPRTPISSLPFTINAPGSYYLTKNLQFSDASGNAITIASSDVTLDLGGFTLSSTAAVTGSAIATTAVSGLKIFNGSISGNTTVAITGTEPNRTWTVTAGGFAIGVNSFAEGTQVHDLVIRGCRNNALVASNKSVVERVNAISCGQSGIVATGGSVSGCTSSGNAFQGIFAANGTVTNSTANSNGLGGIDGIGMTVSSCTAVSNGGAGISADNGSVSRCTFSSNAGRAGIYARYGSVDNCSAFLNKGDGIYVQEGLATGCTARDNGSIGIAGNSATVTGCTANKNFHSGIQVNGGVVAQCTASGNSTDTTTVDKQISVDASSQRIACVPALE